MWIAKSNLWSKKATAFEKFAVERFIQRCDYLETINKKHRTTNGFVQIQELIRYAQLAYKRGRTVKTLISLINEAKSDLIMQNIKNDYIIGKYFGDLRQFILDYNPEHLLSSNSQPNLTTLQSLLHQLKIFSIQLEKHYFDCIKTEFTQLKQDEQEFDRSATVMCNLIDLILPYVLFKGYSLSSIKGLLTRWFMKGYHIQFNKIFSIFPFKVERFSFYIKVDDDNVLEFLKHNLAPELDIKFNTAENVSPLFVSKYEFQTNDQVLTYNFEAYDPHNHIRNFYDQTIKRYIVSKERSSLSYFNNFFAKTYWSFENKTDNINKIYLDGDPVSIDSRSSTLRKTLHECGQLSDVPYSNSEALNNAIFYYNLALGSKSIENSILLLWTSLETILPFRIANSDIECVQHFVSTTLALGSIGRDVYSFASRFITCNSVNENILSDLGTIKFRNIYTTEGIADWYNWIANPTIATQHFLKVKQQSELLAYEYAKLGKMLANGTLDDILNRILSSQISVFYQLQRIYIHRNQIVHSGDLINEYTNLWSHLEWYAGKILAAMVLNTVKNDNESIESYALQLKADYDYLMSYCERNKKKKITDMPDRIFKMLIENPWQYF